MTTLRTYRTFIHNELFTATIVEYEGVAAIGQRKVLHESKRGRDILRISTTSYKNIVFVYSTSAASRAGDEPVGRDYIELTPANRAALRRIGVRTL